MKKSMHISHKIEKKLFQVLQSTKSKSITFKSMSTVEKTMMTPPTPVPEVPSKVVKKRGPKKKTQNPDPKTDTQVVREEAIESDSGDQPIKDTTDTATDKEKTKKPKTPTLSAKHKKYVLYSYYLIEKVRELHPEMDLQFLESAAMIHQPVDQQTAFVEAFDEKAVANSLKLKKKALKDTDKLQTKLINKVLTKIKRTKEIQQQNDDNGNLISITFPNSAEAITDSFIIQNSLVIQALHEKSKTKPTQKKTKKTNNNTNTNTNTNTNDLVADIVAAANINQPHQHQHQQEQEQELEVTLCTIQNNKFLTDNLNNLYHIDTHQKIATFDPTNQTIHYL